MGREVKDPRGEGERVLGWGEEARGREEVEVKEDPPEGGMGGGRGEGLGGVPSSGSISLQFEVEGRNG